MKKSSRKITTGLFISLMLLTMVEPLQAAEQKLVTMKEAEPIVTEQPQEKEEKVKEEEAKEKYTPEIPIPRKSFSMASAKAITTDQKWFTFKGNTITGYSASLDAPKDIVIPSTYEKDGSTYQITGIDDTVFAGMQIKSIVLNDNLKTIGNGAFYNNTEIVDLIIPNSVTSIGDGAFEGCIGLTNVTLSTELTTLSSNIFSETNLAEIVIPSKVTIIEQKSFYKCKNLSSVTFMSSTTLTTIQHSAFYYCEKLTSLTLPDSITTIGKSAFMYCSGLTNVNIPSKMTSLQESVFSDCESLTSVVIPDNIKQLNATAFSFCSKLKDISIGSGTSYIAYNTFYYIAKGAKIRFKTQKAATISSAPWGADDADIYWYSTDDSCFYIKNDGTITGFKPIDHDSTSEHNTSINHTIANIPEKIGDITVTSIEKKAFYNKSITSISLPSTVNKIGESAFSLCTAISKISIPDSVETIGTRAFSACSNLEEVNFGKGIKTIGSNAFTLTKNGIKIHLDDKEVGSIANSPWGASNAQIYWKSEDDSCFYTDSTGNILGFKPLDHGSSADHTLSLNHTKATIPSSINGVTITGIGKDAFKGTPITEVVIPSTITTLTDYAFAESSLTKISLPSSITYIGMYAFDNCRSLETVDLPKNLKEIGVNAFAFTGLKEINLPSQLESIGTRAFISTKLTSITIPANVKSVGMYAFYNSNLKKVEVKNGLTNFTGTQIFANCNQLVDVQLPKEMTSIADSMFENCSSLKSIVLPSSLSTIESSAFQGTSLLEIIIPESVHSIGNAAFASTKITSIEIPNSVTTIGSEAFYNCEKLVRAKLSDSLKEVNSGLFRNDVMLESITIPDSVTTIYDGVFVNCTKLQSVALPSGLKRLKHGVFQDCTSLNELYLPEGLSEIGSSVIDGANVSEITLPSTLTSANVDSLVGFKGDKIYVEQPRDTSDIKNNQPWGAPTGATVYYKGEFTSITNNVTYANNFGKGTIKIVIQAPTGGVIKTITLPDGTIKENVDTETHTLEYEVSKNDSFTFTATSNSGDITTHIVSIDKIEYATIEATGFSLTLSEVTSLTEASVISKAKATAVKNYDNSSLTIKLTTPLADVKNALNKDGNSTIVTLSAQTTIPNTTTIIAVEKKITLYVLKEYTVTFKDWDGSTLKTETIFEGAEAIAPSTNPKRAGYTFTGWDKSLSNIHTDTVFTAQYNARIYTVHYDTNGGTPTTIPDKSVSWSEANLIPAATMTKEHYNFLGWSYGGASNGHIVTDDTRYSKIAEDDFIEAVTLHANWTPITYHLSFNANGGTGSKDSIDFDAGNPEINIGTHTLKKLGCTFEGWNTKADGSGTSLASNADYTPPLQDTILYAQWKEQKPSYYISIPKELRLKDETDTRYVSTKGTIKIIEENVESGTMPDKTIEVRCASSVNLTNSETTSSYNVHIYDNNGALYTDSTQPIMILNTKTATEQDFILRSAKNSLFHRGEYSGILTFTFKFGG